MKLRNRKYLVAIALGTVALAGTASAQIIGIDFNDGGAADQSPGSSAVVGPVPTAGWYNNADITNPPTSYYNPYNGSDTGTKLLLTDNSGVVTTAQFGFNSNGFSTYNGSSTYSPSYGGVGSADSTLTPDQQLFNGGANAASGGYTQQVTLSNVPYLSYSVYVLVAPKDGAVGYPFPTGGYAEVTDYLGGNTAATPPVGATYWAYSGSGNVVPPSNFSYIQATGTTQATATQGANYALFSGLTGSTVTFDVSSPSYDGNAGAYITGLEIVADAPVSVPEPSTYALSLAGLGFLVLIARRRRA